MPTQAVRDGPFTWEFSPTRRRYLLILLAIFVVVGGWLAFWFYAAGEVERRLDIALEDYARQGTQVVCAKRTVGGFPFRIEVRCDKIDILLADDSQVSGGSVRAVALIYKPRHIIVDADGPLSARAAPVPAVFTGQWNVTHASMIFKGTAISAAFLSLEGFDGAMAGGFGTQKAGGERVEVHVRRAPEAAEVALRLDRVSLEGPLVEADPFSAGLLLRLPDGTD